MKRKILIGILIAVAAVCLSVFAGCNKKEENENPPAEPTYYTIQYNDGSENRTLRVKNGDVYSIPVPEKRGYNFIGLFTSKEGGVQYVDEDGLCTMPFSGSSNMVLYAQFEAKTFTVAFDYGEAGNSVYTCTAEYGEIIPMPPQPTYVDGSEFIGWYTEENAGGTCVSASGETDLKKGILNYDNFELDSLPGGRLVLYAGFKVSEYEINFYSADGSELIAAKSVRHGTNVSELEKIIYNGMTVLEWGRTVKGTPVTGEITYEMTLYAVAYGVGISFDSDGGTNLPAENKKSGTEFALPVPERKYYSFVCWTENGEPVENNFRVPERNVTLVAKWEKTHYKVSYNTDGGEETPFEMVEKGKPVSLPSITKTHYAFNGWAYENEIVDDGFAMPEKDITLTAVWEKTHYYLSFSPNGGSSADISQKTVRKGDGVALPTPTRKYYKFTGWKFGNNVYTGSFTMPASDVNLSAQWEQEYKDYTYISTEREFLNIKNNVNGKYMLISNIYITSVQSVYMSTFGGELAGNNYTIELGNGVNSFNLNLSNTAYYGWFTGINTGKLHHFTVKNLIVRSTKEYNTGTNMVYMGGICGWNNGSGIIDNVKIINSVSGNASKSGAQISCLRNRSACGGICGTNGGIISNCSVDALVFGEGDTGGIAGQTGSGISNCKFTGKIGMYVELDNGNISLHSWGGIAGFGNATSSITGCTVTSCSFEYWGENAKCHKTNIFGTHTYCDVNVFVGIICGANKSESNLSGNSYVNCNRDLVRQGGNNHYGDHEKSRLF